MFGQVAEIATFLPGSAPNADSCLPGRLCDQIRAQLCDDYVLIAARSDRTPIMFMTRVRL